MIQRRGAQEYPTRGKGQSAEGRSHCCLGLGRTGPGLLLTVASCQKSADHAGQKMDTHGALKYFASEPFCMSAIKIMEESSWYSDY